MAREITCIVPNEDDPEGGIECVGGPGWTKRAERVIAEIEAGAYYFVMGERHFVDVIVEDRGGRKFLRTDPEQTGANELLTLPLCP